jgi:hypothetical protein
VDYAAINAWATVVLAAVGIVSIGTGVALSVASFRSASAAKASAAAAEQTVSEIRSDRQLEYRPYVSWTSGGWVITAHKEIVNPGSAHVANYGRGPAIHTLCCVTWIEGRAGGVPLVATTDLFDLSPDEDGDVPMQNRSGWVPDDEIAGNHVAESPNRVAFCQDQFGTYYRFVPFEVNTSTWRPGHEQHPRWVEFYLDYFERLKKM